MVRAASAMMAASLASVLASPACRFGDSSHGESREVAHHDALVVGNGDRQRPNGVGLVHDEQHGAVLF
jgi:hypothetical protein